MAGLFVSFGCFSAREVIEKNGILIGIPRFLYSVIEVTCYGAGSLQSAASHENGWYAKPGDLVTFVPIPGNGYKLNSVTAGILGEGTPVIVSGQSFEMPENNVYLDAYFAAAQEEFPVWVSPSDITIDQYQYSYGDTINLRVTPHGEDVDASAVSLRGPDGDARTDWANRNDDGSFTVSSYVNNDFRAGLWTISAIQFRLCDGNVFVYRDIDDYSPNDHDPKHFYIECEMERRRQQLQRRV